MCNTFKAKSLIRPRFDVLPKNTVYNLFHMDMLETKKELKVAAVSQASATILREWKEVKANDKETQKYIDLYEEEKPLYILDW